ncbi:MAG: hypothetical protein ACLT8E_03480 [Akkermansia sp.]
MSPDGRADVIFETVFPGGVNKNDLRLPHTFILSCSAALAFGFLPPAAGQTTASVDRREGSLFPGPDWNVFR